MSGDLFVNATNAGVSLSSTGTGQLYLVSSTSPRPVDISAVHPRRVVCLEVLP